MLAKARLALIALLLVVAHAATPGAVRASTSQEITFEAIPNTSIVMSYFELQGVSSVGLPVSYVSETPFICEVMDDINIFLWDVGTCTIRASQEGDETYSPAEPVWQSFLIFGHPGFGLSQEIVFEAIPSKSILVGSFALQGVSSSGLPVSYESVTPFRCGVDGNMVELFDAGTCTIQASQEGDETYSPADSVLQSFSILRGLIANKTITFVDADGLPISSGRTVHWQTIDGKYYSSAPGTTNAAGQVTFKKIPAGNVYFSLDGYVSLENGQKLWTYRNHFVSVGVAATRVIGLLSPSAIDISNLVVHVKMTDGTSIPGASVSITGGSDQARCVVSREEGTINQFSEPWSQEVFAIPECTNYNITDANGEATFPVMTYAGTAIGDDDGGCPPPTFCNDPYYATAQFTEDDMFVTSETIQIVDGEATILVDQMPVVDLLAESAIVNYGAPQLLTAFARDVDGSPIVGTTLTLSASVSGASASCSGRKTTATTNSSGRATFKVCPVKSATWSVDGQSVVGSAGAKLTVQLTPTTPRTLVVTPKTRSVSLAWVAPAKANANTVTDYIVQYRRQGSTTWLTFRDGVSTARKATVTGLKSGQAYEFRIAARSKAGTGTWSSVLRGTPK